MKPTVTSSEIEKQFGICLKDCECYQMCANDSYVALCLDEDIVQDMKDEIESCPDEPEYVKRLSNNIMLIEYFRDLGYTDEVLIYVSW
jgi:hypothetical protein